MSGDTSEDGSVVLRFVLPRGKNEATCSEELSEAYEKCEDNDMKPAWITSDDAMDLTPTKTDVFVLDPFEGPAFDSLCKFKCTVIGPQTIMSCLSQGVSLPALPYPMYTLAMQGCVVTSTGFEKEAKTAIQTKVQMMGGVYANAFTDQVTHLVARVVRSTKYDVALNKETPIMTDEWVEKVWEKSKHENVRACDAQFAKYKCPCLKNLTIAVSQLNRKDKDLLKRSIESHGGIYSGELDMEKTAILIIPTPEGQKYNYARKWKIPCVSPDWVFDSIEKGFCQSTTPFRIDQQQQVRASSPARPDETAVRLEEVSMCSTILVPNAPSDNKTVKVDETVLGANATLFGATSAPEHRALLDKLEIGRVKKAGPFLEDIRIFLSGFKEKDETQMQRVLQSAGAKRMNQIAASVTHIVMAKEVAGHAALIEKLRISPYRVGLQWVAESMLMGRPVPESDFPFVPLSSRPSPAPRKMTGIKNKKAGAGAAESTSKSITEAEELTMMEDDIMAQYKSGDKDNETAKTEEVPASTEKPNAANVTENTTMQDNEESCTQVERFFTGKKFAVVGFEEEAEAELGEWLEEAGVELVFKDFAGTLDYLVVPVEGCTPKSASGSSFKAAEIVSNLWVEDCLDQGREIKPEGWHRPVDVDRSARPCEGVVIGVTNYVGREREYITFLANALGMVAQEIFSKKDKDGCKRSTHLVCQNPEGKKYEAAIKWKLPVVTIDWLLACQRDMRWVCEKPFLLGDSNTFDENRPMPSRPEEKVASTSTEESSGSISTPFAEKMDIVEDQKKEEDEDIEINFKTPRPGSKAAGRISDANLETPGGLDIEKLRPRPLNLSAEDEGSPSNRGANRWADTQSQSQGSPLKKRKRESSENGEPSSTSPFVLHGIKTPETPYGSRPGNRDPSPKTRKYWKLQLDELKRFDMTEQQKKEFEERKAFMAEKGKEWDERQGAMAKEFAEFDAVRSDPERRKAIHEKWADDMEAKGIPVLSRSDKTFDDLMEEKMAKMGKSWKNMNRANVGSPAKRQRREEEAAAAKVLDGVNVYVTKKCSREQEDIAAAVTSLGGAVSCSYSSDEVTHVVFVGRQNDTAKEFRQAKKDGKMIVCPAWAYMCRDEGRRVDEEVFPHSYNPKMTLNMTQSTTAATRSRSGGGRKKSAASDKKAANKAVEVDETLKEEEDEEAMEAAVEQEDDKEEGGMTEDIAMFDKLIGDASTSRSAVSSEQRRSLKMKLSSSTGKGRRNKDGGAEGDDDDDADMPSSSQAELNSQAISWTDPREEEERRRLKAKLAAETQAIGLLASTSKVGNSAAADATDQMASMEVPENLTDVMMGGSDEKENAPDRDGVKRKLSLNSNSSGPTPPSPKMFILSGYSEADKAIISEFLKKHNVTCAPSSTTSCIAGTTHIVINKLSRSEKMLGSIASGRWVMHPRYISACKEAGRLVPEDDFEWGNPRNGFFDQLTSTLERKLAAASFKWRVEVQSGRSKGALEGIRAIVHSNKQPRVESFCRLVNLGGGKVVKAEPPYSDAKGATHCLYEKVPNVDVNFKALAANGVAVVGPVFINDYLVSETRPKVEDCLAEEFKPFWKARR